MTVFKYIEKLEDSSKNHLNTHHLDSTNTHIHLLNCFKSEYGHHSTSNMHALEKIVLIAIIPLSHLRLIVIF